MSKNKNFPDPILWPGDGIETINPILGRGITISVDSIETGPRRVCHDFVSISLKKHTQISNRKGKGPTPHIKNVGEKKLHWDPRMDKVGMIWNLMVLPLKLDKLGRLESDTFLSLGRAIFRCYIDYIIYIGFREAVLLLPLHRSAAKIPPFRVKSAQYPDSFWSLNINHFSGEMKSWCFVWRSKTFKIHGFRPLYQQPLVETSMIMWSILGCSLGRNMHKFAHPSTPCHPKKSRTKYEGQPQGVLVESAPFAHVTSLEVGIHVEYSAVSWDHSRMVMTLWNVWFFDEHVNLGPLFSLTDSWEQLRKTPFQEISNRTHWTDP